MKISSKNTVSQKKKNNKLRLTIFILLIVVIPLVIITIALKKAEPAPPFSDNKLEIKKVDIHLSRTPDFYKVTSGHYLIHDRDGTLMYDGDVVYNGQIGSYVMSENGLHYAFIAITDNSKRDGSYFEIGDLYVDGQKVLSQQKNLNLHIIVNSGNYIYSQKDVEDNFALTKIYNSETLLQTNKSNYAIGQPILGSLEGIRMSANGKNVYYRLEGTDYINGKKAPLPEAISIYFSDNFRYYLHTTLRVILLKTMNDIFINNEYQTTENILSEPKPIVNDKGQYALVTTSNTETIVYLQSKPYKLKEGAEQIYYNNLQDHLLVGYTTNSSYVGNSGFNWQLDGEDVELPFSSTESFVELTNNAVYVYNILP